MATLKEQLEKLHQLKSRLAVWEAIHFLVDDKFINKDGRKTSGIKVEGTNELVSEEVIEDVLQAIGDGPIIDLKKEISDIENGQVVVLGETKASA